MPHIPPNRSPSSVPAAGARSAGRTSVLVALVRSIHPFPVLTVMVTSGILIVVAAGGVPTGWFLVRALLVVLGSQIAVGALNDFHDRDDDARVQPDKPIPAGLVSARVVLAFAVAGGLLMAVCAASFGAISLLIMLVALSGGVAYDLWLKPTPFAVLGYAVGFLSLVAWIWFIMGHFSPALVVAFPAGLLLLLAAHVANVLPDLETDRQLGHRTLAVLLGRRGSYRLILWCCGVLCATAVVAGLLVHSCPTIALVLPAIALTASAALWIRGRDLTPHEFDTFFRLTAPVIGLLAVSFLVSLRTAT